MTIQSNYDITDATSQEIIAIITQYPNGRLQLNDNRVYWCTEATPTNKQPAATLPQGGGQVAQNQNQLAAASQRMLNTMGSIFGPPGR